MVGLRAIRCHLWIGFVCPQIPQICPDSESVIICANLRTYDPQSGRFLTQDPIGLAGGVNLYAYAANNPIRYRDPFGLDTVEIVSEALRQTVETMRSDPLFDSVYTALDQDPRVFRLIGTDVVPDDPLNQFQARFTGKSFARDQYWGGFEQYLPFTDARDVGVAIVGMRGPNPGKSTGHEMGHLLQIKDGLPRSHTDRIMTRIISYVGY